jgi:flagellar assembly protein FliH
MAMEKSIIKSSTAAKTTFEYKPRELGAEPSGIAKSFVNEDSFRSTDFKISELIAEQVGISQLESDAHQDKINSQVLEKLKEVQEQAYQEGYQLGLIEGTEKAFVESKANLLDRLQSLEKLLKRVEDLKTRLLIDNEAGLIQLVFHTAKKIAMRDLQENQQAVVEILKNVIGEIQENERVTVYLSSQDLEFLETLQQKSGQKIESLQRVKFSADSSLTSGGCKIETDYGSVNATVEERVERTWQTLQARVPQQLPEKLPKVDKPEGSES